MKVQFIGSYVMLPNEYYDVIMVYEIQINLH